MNDKARKKTGQGASGANSNAKMNVNLKQTKRTLKHWIAGLLFAVIVVAFAQLGVNPARFGENLGGVAATVNDSSISLAEYRARVESFEQNARGRMDQFPEAQRKLLMQELRRRALEELIMGEVVYQAAKSKGIEAPDGEVRDYILQIPFLQENGRFLKERYHLFLQNMNLSTQDFERQVRKQIVGQKLQELFIGSAVPTREELKRNRMLTNQKVNLRYVEINKEDFKKRGFISSGEVAAFLKSKKEDVEKYYKENTVEFTKLERIQVRHILFRVDDKRPASEALKLASSLRKELTPQNFAKLAEKNSDDPGSKAKGGSLGEFERGRMVPEFEKAAFAMEPGQISEPIKTSFGYHIIYLEKKTPGGTQALEQVQDDIARKLLLRAKEDEVVVQAKELVNSGDKKDIDAFVHKSGLKWMETGEFDLSSPVIPKLGDSKDVVNAVLKHGKASGLVKQVIDTQGRHYIIDVLAWKELPDKGTDAEGVERMVANRKSSDLIEAWSKEIEATANVQRNPRALQ